ncbi:MAG: hypothetical protein IKK84_00550 [Clostridia bacterium]|nr:hypothetical protein [Clostridia bacterium]MBR6641141.1 hypothetical protein [Clostridia bacterium]
MERHELEALIREEKCIKGGTKEACIKIREVLNHQMNPGNQLHAPGSSVSIEEFLDAVEVLVGFALEHPDKKVYKYCCESDCAYAHNPNCKGRLIVGIKKRWGAGTVNVCPYHVEEDK